MEIRKEQAGRSMVEMLGAMAIIGVLTVGGIAGYVYAMNLYRENQTVDIVNKVAAGAVTGFLDKAVKDGEAGIPLEVEKIVSGIEGKDEYTIETALQTEIVAYHPRENEIEIELSNVTYSVCKKLLEKVGEYTSASLKDDSETIFNEDTKEDKEDFCKRVDSFERSPMHPGERVNADANMVLCYSLGGGGCDGGYVPPPEGPVCEDYGVCGQKCNGVIHVHPDKMVNPANICEECDATTYNGWRRKANCCLVKEDCSGACENCIANRCQAESLAGTYKAYEGNCCVTKTVTYCAGESAPMDECTEDKTETVTTGEECSSTTTVTNLCSGETISSVETVQDSGISCGSDGCSQCDGSGSCQSWMTTIVHSDLNATSCACESHEESYCALPGSSVPTVRTCSVPPEPTCEEQTCCVLTGPEDACGRKTAVSDTTCCEVESEKYANGATIGECKQCSNGSIVDKENYTLPVCKICKDDGTLEDDTSCDCKTPMLNAGYKYDENGSKNTFKVSGRTITYTGEMSLGSSIKSVNLDISQCDLVVKGFYHSSRSQLKVHDMDVQGTTTRAIELNQAEIIANDITFSATGSDSYSAWAIYNYGSRITANSIKGTGIRAAIHNQGEMFVTGEINVTGTTGTGFEDTGTAVTTCGSITAEGKEDAGISINGNFTASGDVVSIGAFRGLYNNGSMTVGGNVTAKGGSGTGATLYGTVNIGGDLIVTTTGHWGADARGSITAGGLFKATGGKGYGIYDCSNCKASSVISCLNGTCSNLCGNRGVTCTGQ